ncbi:hypothetical protein DFH07DRAFT_924707 [Mycena maculata]|uniref:Uncharacterized protein n=1 Tax=Mycena maculata TaxID=230809 RepID=A0AAD7INF9_9AGAR|nr:hypothetical protein DFH07DRAFT_924707 [Mycena maculata]
MASSSVTTQSFSSVGEGLIYDVVGLVAQTFVFGLFTILISLSTRMLLKRGLRTLTNWVILFLTVYMYLLASAYWGYCIAVVVDRMLAFIAAPPSARGTIQVPDHDNVTKWSPLFNAVALINYVLSDGVVVWRAWIICQRRLRKYLWIAIVFLMLTATSVFLTIGFRGAAFMQAPIKDLPEGSPLVSAINVLQISNIALSLVSNSTAMAVVAATAWRHRRILRAAFTDEKTTSTANQILFLVVESGLLYCVSAITVLVASLIRLPHGTLGDLYTPISIQFAGAYPSIVTLLVSTKRSLNETAFSHMVSSDSIPSQPLRFGSAYTSPTSTVGGPEPMDITGRNSMLIAEAKPVQLSRFSDDSLA